MTDPRMIRFVRAMLPLCQHEDREQMAEAMADYMALRGVVLPPVPQSDLGRRAPLTDKPSVIAN